MNIFDSVKNILDAEYSRKYVYNEEKDSNGTSYIIIEGFTHFGSVAISLANFPEAPPSGVLCQKQITFFWST